MKYDIFIATINQPKEEGKRDRTCKLKQLLLASFLPKILTSKDHIEHLLPQHNSYKPCKGKEISLLKQLL
jgi:hypothetical protein